MTMEKIRNEMYVNESMLMIDKNTFEIIIYPIKE